MSELITQTARLVPYGKRPKQAPSLVTAYAYEPLADEPGSDLGNLYVVLEVLVAGRASEEVADLIIDTFGDHFYNQGEPDASDVTGQFERAIKTVNNELAEHVNRGSAAWIGKLSAIVAVQSGANLHVAQTGSAEAFLYRGRSSTRISTGALSRPTTPTKTFGSIATGQLETDDRLLLATPALIHQIHLDKLQSLITESSPNAAIAEITELLHGASTDRIAALIIKLTTPELAALQVRSEEPNEIHLGSPENAFEATKLAAAPITQTTTRSGKKLASAIGSSWKRFRPRARAASLAVADHTRQAMSTKSGRRNALIGLILIVVIIIGLIFASNLISKGTKKPSASQSPQQTAQTTNQIVVKPTTIAQLPNRHGEAKQFELSGNNAYLFDAANHNALSIVNLATGQTRTSATDFSVLGTVLSTSVSAQGTGIYILTNTPAVWFYNFNADTLAKQTVAYSKWPAATAIASYLTNLYLLTESGVYKYLGTENGFSPGAQDVTTTGTPAADASSMAIDGSIYIVSQTGLYRFISGSLDHTASIPATLTGLTNLRSTADGTLIIATSPSTKRLGTWSASSSSLTFNKQITISGQSSLYNATYNSTTGRMYATCGNRLVSFKFQP